MDPKITASFAAFVLATVLLFARRRVCDLSCTGVFFISYALFVGLGVLASPWLMEGYLQESFSYIRWDYITARDLNVTITSISLGLLAVLAGSYAADAIHPRGSSRWLELLRGRLPMPLGTKPNLLFLVYCGLTVIAIALLATKLTAVSTGLVEAYIHQNHEAYYRARETVQELGLPYYLIIYNALPFCAQALFLAGRLHPLKHHRLCALLWLLPPVFFLVMTFEKTALVLFLLLSGVNFMIARFYTGSARQYLASSFSLRHFARALRRMRRHLWFPLTAAICVLMFLYTLTTDSIVNQSSGLTVAGKAFVVVMDRICLRLAVMPLMYAHYFPQVEPLYGLTNVGKLTILTGAEYFPDTHRVLHFFTGVEEGGGAIGSLTDFYSAFGWPGLVCGGFGLGVTLRTTDRLLRSLPPTVINRVFWLYLLYVAWYLSQASVFRCLSSYGGVIFLMLWIVFHLARDSSTSPSAADQPAPP